MTIQFNTTAEGCFFHGGSSSKLLHELVLRLRKTELEYDLTLHMVFDVKMDFTRKARLVAGGHLTDPPASITYSSVVSRDSVRIMFLVAAVNDLQVLAADIGNAYLNAPNRERVYAIAGKEFGSRAGQRVLIVRALYGLKCRCCLESTPCKQLS